MADGAESLAEAAAKAAKAAAEQAAKAAKAAEKQADKGPSGKPGFGGPRDDHARAMEVIYGRDETAGGLVPLDDNEVRASRRFGGGGMSL